LHYCAATVHPIKFCNFNRSHQSDFELRIPKMNLPKAHILLPSVLVIAALAAGADIGKPVTVKGYVLDSACAFTKSLKKPISTQCAVACAKAGSPLVILTDSGTVYWPIAATTPSAGQNEKLLPFAGQKVTASGKVFQRGGSSALVIEKIEAQTDQK
jgi:hypothetical protein